MEITYQSDLLKEENEIPVRIGLFNQVVRITIDYYSVSNLMKNQNNGLRQMLNQFISRQNKLDQFKGVNTSQNVQQINPNSQVRKQLTHMQAQQQIMTCMLKKDLEKQLKEEKLLQEKLQRERDLLMGQQIISSEIQKMKTYNNEIKQIQQNKHTLQSSNTQSTTRQPISVEQSLTQFELKTQDFINNMYNRSKQPLQLNLYDKQQKSKFNTIQTNDINKKSGKLIETQQDLTKQQLNFKNQSQYVEDEVMIVQQQQQIAKTSNKHLEMYYHHCPSHIKRVTFQDEDDLDVQQLSKNKSKIEVQLTLIKQQNTQNSISITKQKDSDVVNQKKLEEQRNNQQISNFKPQNEGFLKLKEALNEANQQTVTQRNISKSYKQREQLDNQSDSKKSNIVNVLQQHAQIQQKQFSSQQEEKTIQKQKQELPSKIMNHLHQNKSYQNVPIQQNMISHDQSPFFNKEQGLNDIIKREEELKRLLDDQLQQIDEQMLNEFFETSDDNKEDIKQNLSNLWEQQWNELHNYGMDEQEHIYLEKAQKEQRNLETYQVKPEAKEQYVNQEHLEEKNEKQGMCMDKVVQEIKPNIQNDAQDGLQALCTQQYQEQNDLQLIQQFTENIEQKQDQQQKQENQQIIQQHEAQQQSPDNQHNEQLRQIISQFASSSEQNNKSTEQLIREENNPQKDIITQKYQQKQKETNEISVNKQQQQNTQNFFQSQEQQQEQQAGLFKYIKQNIKNENINVYKVDSKPDFDTETNSQVDNNEYLQNHDENYYPEIQFKQQDQQQINIIQLNEDIIDNEAQTHLKNEDEIFIQHDIQYQNQQKQQQIELSNDPTLKSDQYQHEQQNKQQNTNQPDIILLQQKPVYKRKKIKKISQQNHIQTQCHSKVKEQTDLQVDQLSILSNQPDDADQQIITNTYNKPNNHQESTEQQNALNGLKLLIEEKLEEIKNIQLQQSAQNSKYYQQQNELATQNQKEIIQQPKQEHKDVQTFTEAQATRVETETQTELQQIFTQTNTTSSQQEKFQEIQSQEQTYPEQQLQSQSSSVEMKISILQTKKDELLTSQKDNIQEQKELYVKKTTQSPATQQKQELKIQDLKTKQQLVKKQENEFKYSIYDAENISNGVMKISYLSPGKAKVEYISPQAQEREKILNVSNLVYPQQQQNDNINVQTAKITNSTQKQTLSQQKQNSFIFQELSPSQILQKRSQLKYNTSQSDFNFKEIVTFQGSVVNIQDKSQNAQVAVEIPVQLQMQKKIPIQQQFHLETASQSAIESVHNISYSEQLQANRESLSESISKREKVQQVATSMVSPNNNQKSTKVQQIKQQYFENEQNEYYMHFERSNTPINNILLFNKQRNVQQQLNSQINGANVNQSIFQSKPQQAEYYVSMSSQLEHQQDNCHYSQSNSDILNSKYGFFQSSKVAPQIVMEASSTGK